MDPFVFGLLIFGSGMTMMGLHWDANFRQKYQDSTDEEVAYYKKQYFRRMIASAMITLVGILFMIYRLLPDKSHAKVWLIAIVLLLVGSIVILGIFDFSSIAQLFVIQRKKSGNAAKELAEEAARLRKKASKKKQKKLSDKKSTESNERDDVDDN